MAIPRLPVAPAPTAPHLAPTMAARHRERPKRWVALKQAADAASVCERTMYRWCQEGLVRARRLAGGRGPWRVRLDRDGLPMDARETQP